MDQRTLVVSCVEYYSDLKNIPSNKVFISFQQSGCIDLILDSHKTFPEMDIDFFVGMIDGLTYLDKDIRIQEKTREETTVVYDMGDTKEPYVVRRERPKVEGVVVVAQGGDRPGIATEITGAIQSLFDLEAHKVKVVKMSVQEESL